MAQTRHKTSDVLLGYINYTDTEVTDSYMKAFDKPTQPQQPEPMKPRIPTKPQTTEQPQNNLKQELTARFIKGEITEAGYLTALKNIENQDDTVLGYQ